MYTYKLGDMLITDELYHDDLETMTFGQKDQNELMHHGIKGQSWGKRRFQNEDGSLTAAGRNRYDVGDPKQGVTAYSGTGGRGGSGVRTYKGISNKSAISTNSQNRYGGASGGGGSISPNGSPTTRTYGGGTNGSSSYSFEYSKGPGQSAGRTVSNKLKAKVNSTVDSGRKAADNLFSSVGNALKPATDTIGKTAEFVTGANANRRVEDAQKAYDEASRDMMVDNRSYVIGTKGTNAEHDAENWQRLADEERAMAKAYDTSANNRGLFDFGGKKADRYQQDQHEAQAREYANKAHELRTQVPKEYEADYRRLEEADRNLRAAEKARDENTLGGVVGNAAKDAGNWVGDRAKDVGNFATNAANDVGRTVGNVANAAGNWVGDRAKDVGNFATNAANAAGNAIGNAARDVGDWASNAASDVRDWGAGALDKGRQAFESLFGRSEPPKAEKLDPTPKTFTENVITEQMIPEQMIPEQRITENRIEEQRIPGNREIETRPTVSGSNNVQTWDNGNINTWDNVKTFGDPGMADIARQYMNQQNSSSSSNAQREQRRQETLSDKPDNVSNEFWEEYKANGGTRDAYERELKNRKSSAVPVSSDKDYVAEQERLRNISAQQDRNGYRAEEVNAPVGTVDNSRPHHFTYDPASGQTIVVYDDEKRR